MRKIQKYEEREVLFAAWILRVARNAALDHVRSRRQIPVEEVRINEDGHEDTLERLARAQGSTRRPTGVAARCSSCAIGGLRRPRSPSGWKDRGLDPGMHHRGAASSSRCES